MASITLNEREYDLLALDKLSFDDQRKLKKITGGMSLARIAAGLDEMDADAWFGVVLLSVQKANPKFTLAELGSVNMVDLLGAIEDDEDDDETPTSAVPAVVVGTASSASTKPLDSAETPETLGTPTTPASSE